MIAMLKIIDFIRKPWAGWAVAAVLLALCWYLGSRPTRYEKVVEWKTKTIIVDKWHTKFVTKPGSTLYIGSDGSATLYGPGEIDTTGSRESSTEASGSTKEKATTSAWRGAITGSVLFPRSTWSAGFTWNVGRVLFFDVGAGPMVEGELDSYVPRRFGALVQITF